MKRIWQFLKWFYTPPVCPGPLPLVEPEPEAIPEPLTALEKIRLNKQNLKQTLEDLERAEEAAEAMLMGERTEVLLHKLRMFFTEVRTGQLQTDFMECKTSINDLQRTGAGWLQYLANRDDLLPNRQRRTFIVNFLDKVGKPNTDFFTALNFISERRSESNPCTKGGKW